MRCEILDAQLRDGAGERIGAERAVLEAVDIDRAGPRAARPVEDVEGASHGLARRLEAAGACTLEQLAALADLLRTEHREPARGVDLDVAGRALERVAQHLACVG